MKFFQRTPFFLFLFGLIQGILIYQYLRPGKWAVVMLAFAGLLMMAGGGLIRNNELQYRLRWLYGAGTMFVFASVAYFSFLLYEQNSQFSDLNRTALFEVELLDAPLEKEKSYQCKVKLLQRYDSLSAVPGSGKAILYLQKEEGIASLLTGDKLIVETTFRTPDGVQNPDGFDYAAYLKKQGIAATAYVASDYWAVSDTPPRKSIRRQADASRRYLLSVYRDYGLDGDEFAVLAALTLGYKDELQPHVKAIYSASGAAHILAVSGLHVGVVYGTIFMLLGFLKGGRRRRILRALISVVFIWAYAFVTGLSPAVIRAALMLSFVAVGSTLERKPRIFNTILMSAFFMLLFRPSLLFNVSFQLSYTAVLSIVALQGRLSKLYAPRNKAVKWLWNLVVVSVAAQLGTAPVTIFYFSQFPGYFLLTNLIAIPLSSLIIYLAIALLIFSPFAFPAKLTAWVLQKLVAALNFSLTKIIGLPGAVWSANINSLQLVLLAVVAGFLTLYWVHKHRTAFLAGLSLLLLFVISFSVRQYSSLTQKKMLVFADSRLTAVNFIDGKSNVIYTDAPESAEALIASFWKNSLLKPARPVESGTEEGFFYFKGRRILVLTGDFMKNRESDSSLDLDYLIVSGRVKSDLSHILQHLKPGMVIVDKTISPWYTDRIRESCEKEEVAFYSVAEKGAFIENF